MKKSKIVISKITALMIAGLAVFALGACGEGAAADHGHMAIYQIQDNPGDFLGDISLSGIVATSATQDFALQTSSGDFEVTVDFRGSQALPAAGDNVTVEGRLIRNRPCCGGGYTIQSNRFQ